jgi:pimeloyl-ACP methyl ester carboxylesterase
VLAGYDWGGRAACVVAALWPERCSGLVSVNDYLIQDIAHAGTPLPAKLEWGIWTQFYFATERGRAGLAANRNDIARLLWTNENPTWHFDDATFQRSATSFANPDYVDVVIHSYRHRLGLAPGYPQYADVEAKLAALPVITVPTVTLDGGLTHHPCRRWPVLRCQVLRQTNPPSGAECGPRPTAASTGGLRRRSYGSEEASLMGRTGRCRRRAPLSGKNRKNRTSRHQQGGRL